MSKKQMWLISIVIYAFIVFFAGALLARQALDDRHSAAAFELVAALVVDEPAEETAAPQMTPYEKYKDAHARNSDMIGWVRIEGTNINYPVMQTLDRPDFYLKHSFEKLGSDYGVPYVAEHCALGICDNTIIYGHHMKDGSMFSDLCKYTDKAFYEGHKTIQFDTLDEYGTYEIAAVFKTTVYDDVGFKFYQFTRAQDAEDFDAYLYQCQQLALYDTGVSAKYGDKLITLSTCEYSQENGRMVVVAKKVESTGE